MAERETALAEAPEAFAARLRIAQGEHQRASVKIDRDRRALEELRLEVVDREDDLLRREGEASLREDLAARSRLVEEEANRRAKKTYKAAAEAIMTAKAEARRAAEEMEAAKEEALRAAQDWWRRLDEAESRVDELAPP